MRKEYPVHSMMKYIGMKLFNITLNMRYFLPLC